MERLHFVSFELRKKVSLSKSKPVQLKRPAFSQQSASTGESDSIPTHQRLVSLKKQQSYTYTETQQSAPMEESNSIPPYQQSVPTQRQPFYTETQQFISNQKLTSQHPNRRNESHQPFSYPPEDRIVTREFSEPQVTNEPRIERRFSILDFCKIAIVVILVLLGKGLINNIHTGNDILDFGLNSTKVTENNSAQSPKLQESPQNVMGTQNPYVTEPHTEEIPENVAGIESIPVVETTPIGDIVPQYVFVAGKYTWEEAETACESCGSHLATVHSDKQWNALMDTVKSAKKIIQSFVISGWVQLQILTAI